MIEAALSISRVPEISSISPYQLSISDHPGWVTSSIESRVRSTVTYITDSYQLWLDLKKRFSFGNQVRIHQIKSELATCKQEAQSVFDYFGRLSTLWEEFQNYQPVITCTFSTSVEFAKANSEEKIHQFVMGLDDARFGSLFTSIMRKRTVGRLLAFPTGGLSETNEVEGEVVEVATDAEELHTT